MSSLEAITKFVVPEHVVRATDQQLRLAGQVGCERFVLWSGVQDGEKFNIRTAHVPAQTAYKLPDGLCVRVEGTDLHRLNVWLFEHGEELAVQVHSHPTDAYHSYTDDAYPIVAIRGGLSIVVPDFAREGILGQGVAYYRLAASGWDELSLEEILRTITFDGVSED